MNAPVADLLVFIDVICPWCFVGKRRLERALTMIGPESVRVTWLPFELNPDMPKRRHGPPRLSDTQIWFLGAFGAARCPNDGDGRRRGDQLSF